MKNICFHLILLITVQMIPAQTSADSLPYIFKAGDTARAASVNDNFSFLLNKIKKSELKIDSLFHLNNALTDSLAKTKSALADSIVKTAGKLANAALTDSLAGVITRLADSITKITVSTQSLATRAELADSAAKINLFTKSLATSSALSDSIAKITTLTGLLATRSELTDSLSRTKKEINLPIGTIIGSILNPEQFAQQFPAGAWKLADSSQASSEYFAITGNSRIPDLRGRFLRGLNYNIDSAKGDPNGNSRTAGDFQGDDFSSHTHRVAASFGNADYQVDDTRATGFAGWAAGFAGYTGGTNPAIPGGLVEKSGSSQETRPRNVSVYWYIRVK